MDVNMNDGNMNDKLAELMHYYLPFVVWDFPMSIFLTMELSLSLGPCFRLLTCFLSLRYLALGIPPTEEGYRKLSQKLKANETAGIT